MTLARRLAVVSGALLALVLVIAPAGAQYRPVLPKYEGFTENGDGSYTLVFGYDNANRVAVKIPIGPGNSFTPFPQDRRQPVLFLPGRHRAACVIVMPPDFQDSLQWTLSLVDSATTSTEVGSIDPFYELGRRNARLARELSRFEPRDAPRGICVNRPPHVEAGRDRRVRLPEVAFLHAAIRDDGLPRTGSVAVFWEQLEGPGDVVIADAKAASTRVVFREPGLYELQVTVTDGALETTDTVIIEVEPPFAASEEEPGPEP